MFTCSGKPNRIPMN